MLCSTFTCWQLGHSAINPAIFFFIPFHQQILLKSWYTLKKNSYGHNGISRSLHRCCNIKRCLQIAKVSIAMLRRYSRPPQTLLFPLFAFTSKSILITWLVHINAIKEQEFIIYNLAQKQGLHQPQKRSIKYVSFPNGETKNNIKYHKLFVRQILDIRVATRGSQVPDQHPDPLV